MPPLLDVTFYFKGEEICLSRAQCEENRNALYIMEGKRYLWEKDAGHAEEIYIDETYCGLTVLSLVTEGCLFCNLAIVMKCLAAHG